MFGHIQTQYLPKHNIVLGLVDQQEHSEGHEGFQA